MIGQIVLLVIVSGALLFILVCYFYFFKRARSVDAQRLNEIYFGRTNDYTYPVEDREIKLVGKLLSEEELPNVDLSGWKKHELDEEKD